MKMKTSLRYLLLAAVAATGLSASAHAAVMTREYELDASRFELFFGSASPGSIDPVFLNFGLTFDNSADVGPTTSGLTLLGFNLPFGIEYAYTAATDHLTIGTDIDPGSCASGANSFCAFVHDATSAAPDLTFFQQVTASNGVWRANVLSVDVTDTPGVPEPASWALMILGFGAAGALLRRREASSASVA